MRLNASVVGPPSLDATLLARSASVVRDRCDVFDQLDLQAGRLKSGDGAFATRTRAFDPNFHVTHAELCCLFGGLLSRTLTGKGRALSAALETTGPGAGPAECVAFDVGDGHRRVVERRVYVGNAVGHVSPHAFLFVALCHCKVLKLQTVVGLLTS